MFIIMHAEIDIVVRVIDTVKFYVRLYVGDFFISLDLLFLLFYEQYIYSAKNILKLLIKQYILIFFSL